LVIAVGIPGLAGGDLRRTEGEVDHRQHLIHGYFAIAIAVADTQDVGVGIGNLCRHTRTVADHDQRDGNPRDCHCESHLICTAVVK
jgi:hypothetical protein